MTDAYICDAIRTPFGRYGGALASVRADDLAAIPIAALVARNAKVDWGALDDVIFGCANQAGEDNRNVARMALLLAGLPKEVPGSTVNRLCGSSMDAIAIVARALCGWQGGCRVFALDEAGRYDDWLALRQLADESEIRHGFHAGNR